MRVPLFSRFGGGGALLQIAPIGTYTMSYYLTAKRMSMAAKVARRRRQGCGGGAQAAAGDRFCSGYHIAA